MLNRYFRYRSYGHGRLASATLALPLPLFILGGVAAGYSFWAIIWSVWPW